MSKEDLSLIFCPRFVGFIDDLIFPRKKTLTDSGRKEFEGEDSNNV